MNGLIYTSDSQSMFEVFKNSIKEEFAMTDLGKMKYFLGVKVRDRFSDIHSGSVHVYSSFRFLELEI